ncbi:kinase-like domain-containing protein [Trametes maxima]|nr:kinase-like domain-containing protein [Trametes maxima]
MAAVRMFFSCLFTGLHPAPSPSTTQVSPVFGMRSHTSTPFALTRSTVLSNVDTAPTTPSTTRATTFANGRFEHAERLYGLGFLVAKAIGLRLHLRLVPRSTPFARSTSSNNRPDSRSPSPLTRPPPQTPQVLNAPAAVLSESIPKISLFSPCLPPVSQAASIYVKALEHCYAMPVVIVNDKPGRTDEEKPLPRMEDMRLAYPSPNTQPSWSIPATTGHSDPQGDNHNDELTGDTVFENDTADIEDLADEDDVVEDPRAPDGTVYRIFGMLGEGAFGRVMAAVSSKGKMVALKVMHKPMLYQSGYPRNLLFSERDIMVRVTKLAVPFLMPLEAAWEQGDNVYLAMELCPQDLRSRIMDELHEEEVKLLCAELLLALDGLAKLRIVHGDIKPENVLITATGHAMLSDVGHAQCQHLDPNPENRTKAFEEWSAPGSVGTPGYYSPEALCRDRKDPVPFTSKTDVFSLGLVFVELMTGISEPLWDGVQLPTDLQFSVEAWNGMDQVERQAARMMTEGLKRVLDSDTLVFPSDAAKNLMLQPNPADRPTAAALLQHSYFKDLMMQDVRAMKISHIYEPRFFDNLNRINQDVAFLTWKHRRQDQTPRRLPGWYYKPLPRFTFIRK